MPFWKRAFQFDDKKLDAIQKDKRIHERYEISPNYPLTLTFEHEGKTWNAKILNVGLGGIGLEFLDPRPSDDLLRGKSPWMALLGLEHYKIRIGGEFVPFKDLSLSLGFRVIPSGPNKEEILASFYHTLYPVLIGNSLEEIPHGDVQQIGAEYTKRMFTGMQGCLLSVWYPQKSNIPCEFEITMEDLVIRGTPTLQLDYYLIPGAQKEITHKTSPINFAIVGNNNEKWGKNFFRWIILHLPKNFPIEIREYFERYI